MKEAEEYYSGKIKIRLILSINRAITNSESVSELI